MLIDLILAAVLRPAPTPEWTAQVVSELPANPMNKFIDCRDSFWAHVCQLPEPDVFVQYEFGGPGFTCVVISPTLAVCRSVHPPVIP
jgi:hypothetical protein